MGQLKQISFAIAIIFSLITNSFGQIHGSVSSNPAGGQDLNVVASKSFGTDDHNVGAGVFGSAASNTNDLAGGGFVNYNYKDHGLSASKTWTPNSETVAENARINLFKNDFNRLDTNLQHSHTKLNNGLDFNKFRSSLDYNHANGHGASIGYSTIPKFDMKTVDLMGKANLWRSVDRATTFDATGTASRHLSGPFNGQTNYGFGLGLTHRF